MIDRRTFVATLGASGCLGWLTDRVSAETYPSRPVTIIVPFPPGGNSDVVIRLVSDGLAAALGQPIVVEHRPGGAGGTVGTKAVVTAAPDGHTLLFSSPGPLVVAPAVYKNLGYDPTKALTPIATIFSTPQILVVNPAVPARTLQELLDFARANPGQLTFASPGYGTQPHLLGEMLRLETGIDIVHVPYKGPAQIVTDLISGQVKMNFETAALLLPHVQAGTLRALAVAAESRSPHIPDVPTTTESGFPKLQATFWTAVLAPAGTPQPIIERLGAVINESLRSNQLQSTLAKLAATPKIGTPEEITAFMAAEAKKWKAVVVAAKISVD